MANNYHWHLAKASEVKAITGSNRAKMVCPQCGCATYKVYVDNSGRMLDMECGKCDRENSCQYHKTPSEWLKEHPEGRGADDVAKRLPPPPEKKPFYLPIEMVRQRMATTSQLPNTLVTFLRSLDWTEEQRAMLEVMLRVYAVGSGRDGSTIFWQIDKDYRVRSGKIMHYLADGHRDKQHFGTWVHSQLIKAGRLSQEGREYVGCLFGEHLLTAYSSTPEIAIVESEKSAIIAATYFRDWERRIWIATAGKGGLSHLKLLQAIQSGKRITLYPDHDAYEDWCRKAAEIDPNIRVSTYVEKNFDPRHDKSNADIADILLRKMGVGVPLADVVTSRLGHPEKREVMDRLIKTFDLKIKK